MPTGYVYLITNSINSKKYVGCTLRTLEHRWKKHVNEARQGSSRAICRAIRKHGPSKFQVECLEVIHGSRTDLMAAEVRHIFLQECTAPKGYNLTKGGDGVDLSVPGVRERHRRAIQKAVKKPEWRRKNREITSKQKGNPEWIKARTEDARKRAADPDWRKANAERTRKQVQDPSWEKAHANGVRKRTKDPSWVTKNAPNVLRLHSDPEIVRRHKESAARMAANPLWQAQHAEMIRKRSSNPKWKKAQVKARALACRANTRKALIRDALCTPEERLLRQKRRKSSREYRKRKLERKASLVPV